MLFDDTVDCRETKAGAFPHFLFPDEVGGQGLTFFLELLFNSISIVRVNEPGNMLCRRHGMAADLFGRCPENFIKVIVEGEGIALYIVFPVTEMGQFHGGSQLGLQVFSFFFSLFPFGNVLDMGNGHSMRAIVVLKPMCPHESPFDMSIPVGA